METILIKKDMVVFKHPIPEGREILNQGDGILIVQHRSKNEFGERLYQYALQPEYHGTTVEEFLKEVKKKNDEPNISVEQLPDSKINITKEELPPSDPQK